MDMATVETQVTVATHELLYVVVPTYNEAENVALFLRAVHDALLHREHRILIIDDSSPDGTADRARELADREGLPVDVLVRDTKDGLGRAYVVGFQTALSGGATLVAQMDCDFSHSPEDLVRLLERADAGAPLVIGSRYVPGGDTSEWSRLRLALSRLASFGTRLVLPTGVRDSWGGFKVWDAHVLEAVDLADVLSEGFSFQAETTFRARRAGYRAVEVPITFHERAAGSSKMHAGLILEGLLKLPRLRASMWLRRADGGHGRRGQVFPVLRPGAR
jgi:dolichol-phosphate mannosyltransferase